MNICARFVPMLVDFLTRYMKSLTLWSQTAAGLKNKQTKNQTMWINNKSMSFTYLGSVIAVDGGTEEDIKTKVGKASTTFKTLNRIWKTKIILLNSTPALKLYYCMDLEPGGHHQQTADIHKSQTHPRGLPAVHN